jgi:putative ABC transport system ATP-binding protein
MNLIDLQQVAKRYVNGADCVIAIDKLTLGIREGAFLGVMGPSGSGKSTLLSVLGVLTRPSSGTVFIDGIDVYGLSPEKQADFRREYLGFIFQSHNLIPYLNALENVMLPLAVSRPQQLSGGEQERVAIARALVNNPPLLLADEPTGSLDTATSNQVMELLAELHREGQTIVMVTHNRENLEWFDRTVYLRDGQIEKDSVSSAYSLSRAM